MSEREGEGPECSRSCRPRTAFERGIDAAFAIFKHLGDRPERQRARPADIVITDIYMPDKDGLEALMELRRDFPEVKVIAISGGVSKQNILQVASALGACRTLVKPFEPAELLQVVEQLAAS